METLEEPPDIGVTMQQIQSKVEELFTVVYAAPLAVQTMAVEWLENKISKWWQHYDVYQHGKGPIQETQTGNKGEMSESTGTFLKQEVQANKGQSSVSNFGKLLEKSLSEGYPCDRQTSSCESRDVTHSEVGVLSDDTEDYNYDEVDSSSKSDHEELGLNLPAHKPNRKTKGLNLQDAQVNENDKKPSRTTKNSVHSVSLGYRVKGRTATKSKHTGITVNTSMTSGTCSSPTRRSCRVKSKQSTFKNACESTRDNDNIDHQLVEKRTEKVKSNLGRRRGRLKKNTRDRSTGKTKSVETKNEDNLDCKANENDIEVNEAPSQVEQSSDGNCKIPLKSDIKTKKIDYISKKPKNLNKKTKLGTYMKGGDELRRELALIANEEVTQMLAEDLSEEQLLVHEITGHSNRGRPRNTSGKTIECHICKKKLVHRSSLRYHMMTHSDERPYKCKECDQSFKTPVNLRNHFVAVHGGEEYLKFQCRFCDFRAVTNNQVVLHERHRHTGDKPFLCDICGFAATSVNKLKTHKQMAHTKADIQCEECGYKVHSMPLLKAHQRRVHQDKQYCCSVCDSVLKSKGTLTVHMRSHTGEKPHQCPTCGKRFINHSDVYYQCELCGHISRTIALLNAHRRYKHGPEELRRHDCPICNTVLKSKGSLIVHMRSHTGESPYICPTCGKGFTSASRLASHKRIHGDERVSCPTCGKKLLNKHKLNTHMFVHTGRKDFTCPLCQYSTYTRFNLKKHCMARHKLDYPPRIKEHLIKDRAPPAGDENSVGIEENSVGMEENSVGMGDSDIGITENSVGMGESDVGITEENRNESFYETIDQSMLTGSIDATSVELDAETNPGSGIIVAVNSNEGVIDPQLSIYATDIPEPTYVVLGWSEEPDMEINQKTQPEILSCITPSVAFDDSKIETL